MKKLLFLGLLLPTIAFAQVAPTGGGLTVDQITQMLENALMVAAGIPGVFGAVFVAIIGLAIAVLIIANYFYNRGARETAAYAAQQQVAATQATNLAQMQADASQALIDNMDTVYQQDYAYFVQMLTAGNTIAIYAKLNVQFQAQLADFIYNQALPVTQRAAQIIMLMQQAAQVNGQVKT